MPSLYLSQSQTPGRCRLGLLLATYGSPTELAGTSDMLGGTHSHHITCLTGEKSGGCSGEVFSTVTPRIHIATPCLSCVAVTCWQANLQEEMKARVTAERVSHELFTFAWGEGKHCGIV